MKSYKQFKENNTCKVGEYYCNTDQKCKPIPSGFKVNDTGLLVKEDAPVNNVGGGNIAGVGIGPAGEPGIKRKKKKTIVMGTIKRNIKENFDNNNVMLKQVLDGLDKVDVAIDTMNNPKTEIQVIKEQPKKSFKERYNVR
jgi:hypothetical protein